VGYILNHASDSLHQQTILERWPDDRNPPNRATLLRWLTRATQQGLIRRAGSGHKGDATARRGNHEQLRSR
jgi:hypothetical protein